MTKIEIRERLLLNGLSCSPFRGCFGQVLFSPVFDCGFQNGAKIRFAHFCKNFPALAGFCKISIPFLRICAPFTFAPWQTFQDLRSSLSVSQPFRSVGTPPPWSWAATWLTLRTGSSPWMLLRWGFVWGRAAFCLRSALAPFDVHALPWAELRDYFIKRQ